MTERATILLEAERVIRKSNFTREDSARADSLLRLAEQLTDRTELRHATLTSHDSLFLRHVILPAKLSTFLCAI